MDKISRLHKKEVGEAAFMVLKAPDIPALLIETGFISNPGEAKKLVGDHHKDLDSALKALVDHFGDPTKIWKSCKEDAKKKLGGNFAECWGFYGDQKRVLAIAAAIEFLREASELAVIKPDEQSLFI